MVNFSSLMPKTRLRSAVLSIDGSLTAPISDFSAICNAVLGGEKHDGPSRDNSPAQENGGAELCGFSRLRNGIRYGISIGNLREPFGFRRQSRVGGPTQLRVFRFQNVNCSFSSVAEALLSNRIPQGTEVERPITDSSEPDGEGVRKLQIGENVSKKDKMRFLVNILLDIKDSKEAVYGALDAWVAWERNFPIASLKRVLCILEKEEQWHRIVQVIKWMLSKGQGNTMGTYGQLIRALDKDHRAEEAHNIWVKKIGSDLHSVPWQLCRQMIGIYYRNNMLKDLVKLFKGLEAFDRKPPEKSIVQRVADAYEMLGLLEEKRRVLEKYSDLFTERQSAKKSRKEPAKKNKKSAKGNHEDTASDNLPKNEEGQQECQI